MTHLDSKANIDVDGLEKLRISANINCGYIAPSLFQLIGNRQHVAKLLLSGCLKNEESVIQEYEYLDRNIKMILGV